MNRRILVNSRDPIVDVPEEALDNFKFQELLDKYPDSEEEVDPDLPDALIEEIAITIFVEYNHAHNKITRRSITRL